MTLLRWIVDRSGCEPPLLMLLASGPALSWLAMVFQVPSFLLVLRRLRIEDRLLHAELGGYSDYARRVRFRVVPGVW